jgi:ferritin
MRLMNERLIQLLNFRIKAEEDSSRLYKAMAVYLEYNGYQNAAKLWEKYSSEELKHAEWAYDFLQNLNVMPKVQQLDQPTTVFQGLPDIILASLDHEYVVTEQCQELARAAQAESDFMTFELAMKYLHEQNEEIGKMTNLVDELNTFGTTPEALRLLDMNIAKLL